MEASTGTILYAKNIHAQYYPASITKILTALLVIENCEMDEIVTIPHDAVYMEDKGSHIALDEGEELTVEDCLYGMLLPMMRPTRWPSMWREVSKHLRI